MRLPSLVKLPKNKRFNYEPRYYDPEKEELQERIQRIEAQVKAEKEGQVYVGENRAYRISQAFRAERQKPSTFLDFGSRPAFLRLLIATSLIGLGYLWLEHGDTLFEVIGLVFKKSPQYWFLGIVVVYAIIKFSKIKAKS